MSRIPWSLIRKNMVEHWLRSGLTMASITVAIFLFCSLVSLVTSLDDAVKESASNRVLTQSAVSLFVELPLDYQSKIAGVPGVDATSKFQWFGGFYQNRENFFAQFGVDHEIFFDMYENDMAIVEARGTTDPATARARALEDLRAERRGAIVGDALMRKFQWKVGDTVPLIESLFSKVDGSAWEFEIVGVYEPRRSNVDPNTLWFRFDYLEETLDSGEARGPSGVGCYAINLTEGVDAGQVCESIDALFANGPQRTKTTTEAAFQAIFVSMMGNLPMFVGGLGGGVVFAVVFSLVNTMLMAARQRIPETGILKALGFSRGAIVTLMFGESMLLSLLGGTVGLGLAYLAQFPVQEHMGAYFPNYAVETTTLLWALALTAGIGVLAGIAPSIIVARLNPTAALRNEG